MFCVGKTISMVKNATICCGLRTYNLTTYGVSKLEFDFVAVFRTENKPIDEIIPVG